jgi:hypothetical protein
MYRATPPSGSGRPLLVVLALSAIVGLIAAGASTGMIGLLPPTFKSPSRLHVAVASTHVLVDSAPPDILHRPEYPVPLVLQHAELLGGVMTSERVLERIGRRAGVNPRQIAASAPVTTSVPVAFAEPGSEQRAHDIRESGLPYRLEVEARQTTPVLDVSAQAPTTEEAERLADAAVAGLGEYLRDLADRRGFDRSDLARLRQLGKARGETANAGMSFAIGLLSFVAAFLLSCAALLYALRRRAGSGRVDKTPRELEADDDWPHTTRLLPWMLAGFMAIIWLVPFNQIELTARFPVDVKLDRLVLPLVVFTWVLALVVGGRLAPRLRMTWIHAAIAAFVGCAVLSVILNARDLNQSLELGRVVKQLPLLFAYVSVFLVAASTVRPREVRAFLTYGLGLAVICALGMLFEYRYEHNLFYDWSDKLLPGIFAVNRFDAGVVDELGRRLVSGPTDVPLEAVAMLSMALPIALVRLMHPQRWSHRLVYAIAACLLLAAMLATYRKSALLAPLSVTVTLAYFRRRELLKLAPLALVLVVVVHLLAPGAIGSTTRQFDPSRLAVATVSDRAADYDAVRPDLWTNLLIGRGWGSYDHVSYRILDSELLHRLIEIGVLGLVAFALMGVSVIVSARATIASRDPTWAPSALIGAAAAVSFLVVSMLFDVLSFPHPTYMFFLMAAFVTVVIRHPRERQSGASARRETSTAGGSSVADLALGYHRKSVERRTVV